MKWKVKVICPHGIEHLTEFDALGYLQQPVRCGHDVPHRPPSETLSWLQRFRERKRFRRIVQDL